MIFGVEENGPGLYILFGIEKLDDELIGFCGHCIAGMNRPVLASVFNEWENASESTQWRTSLTPLLQDFQNERLATINVYKANL